MLVVAAFGRTDPLADLRTFDEDLVLADMEIVTNRLKRVENRSRKPLPRMEHDQLVLEQKTLQSVLAAMEEGRPLREDDMSEEQLHVTRSFRLLSEKPRVVVQHARRRSASRAADGPRHARGAGAHGPGRPGVGTGPHEPEDRAEFEQDLGVGRTDRDQAIRTLLTSSRQRLFLTAGEKEVRTWLLPQGGTALDAAASIHTDLARGFIRAEIMNCSDLVRLGSERDVKAQHLVRQEPKDYVIQDDDILLIRFSV